MAKWSCKRHTQNLPSHSSRSIWADPTSQHLSVFYRSIYLCLSYLVIGACENCLFNILILSWWLWPLCVTVLHNTLYNLQRQFRQLPPIQSSQLLPIPRRRQVSIKQVHIIIVSHSYTVTDQRLNLVCSHLQVQYPLNRRVLHIHPRNLQPPVMVHLVNTLDSLVTYNRKNKSVYYCFMFTLSLIV